MAKLDRLTVETSPIIPKLAAVSSLREKLIARAAGGDPAAWRIVESLIPATLPAGVVRAARDDCIVALGDMLRAMMPGTSVHQLSHWLADAGAALYGGHASAARALPFLTLAELAIVDSQIREVLSWSSIRHDGTRCWPRARQIFAILSR